MVKVVKEEEVGSSAGTKFDARVTGGQGVSEG